MGKYRSYQGVKRTQRPWKVHPIWRGIGCILLLLIPIISYAGAFVLVRANYANRWVAIPEEMRGYSVVPYLGRLYYADLAIALVLTFIVFAIITAIYTMVYSMVGPARYGPTDSPPLRRKPRKNR